MRRRVLVCCVVLWVLHMVAPSASGASAEETEKAVNVAVDRLLAAQQGDGSWKEPDELHGGTGYDVGRTALVALALSRSGSPKVSRSVRGGLHFITHHAPEAKTYTAGLAVMLLVEEDPERYRKLIELYASMVVKGQRLEGPGAGGWTYGILNPTAGTSVARAGRTDNSNTQFAVMALHWLEKTGRRIPKVTWKLLKHHYEINQNRDGGWSYLGAAAERASGQEPSASTLSMTAAGSVSLHLTERALNRARGTVPRTVQAGIDWIAKSQLAGPAYTWLALQRLGTHTGRDKFGDKDWRALGTDSLVTRLNGRPDSVPNEALALLFLAGARASVDDPKLTIDGEHRDEP